jgi:preprotein translocase subunit SecY
LRLIKQIFKNRELRGKILYVLGILFIFRLISHVPIPGPDPTQVKEFLAQFFGNNTVLGFLDIFSGGGLSNFSIVLMGVGPYITASIIMQLLTMVIPNLNALSKEGERGHHTINQYSRYLTVPIAALQGYSMLRILQRTSAAYGVDLIGSPTVGMWILMLLSITAGTLFLMWLGELITEKGIGNGVSLIIFAGIVSQVPGNIAGSLAPLVVGGFEPTQVWQVLAYLALAVFVIFAIVVLTEGVRKIPVSYAKKIRGNQMYGGMDTHLPLRINMAGVIPIIFAGAFMNLPQIVGLLANARTEIVANFARWVVETFVPTGAPYAIAFFLLIVGFTYFSTFLYFNPNDISENIQKQGGFIPGIRPGKKTAEYLVYVLNRLTLTGALFLGLLALLPFILQALTGSGNLIVGGTSLLIVVAVVLETMQKIKAQLIMHTYER